MTTCYMYKITIIIINSIIYILIYISLIVIIAIDNYCIHNSFIGIK